VNAAPDGDGWLVADPGTFGLYRARPDGTLSTITTDLDIPQGLARFDDSSVLVADLRSGIGAVMRVTLDGVVTVFAEIDSPKGIATDGGSGFVVVSHGDRALYRLGRDGRVSTLYRGTPLDFPHDVVQIADGSFIVTDGYAGALFRVSGDGEVTILAQGLPLIVPQGIALGADGSLFVTDPQAGAVFRVDAAGAVERWVGVGG
jgi:sugar lactone lactonase YvrE